MLGTLEFGHSISKLKHRNGKENIDKSLVIENPFGDTKNSVSELVPHAVNHGTYHRGNIKAMLRQMSYASAALRGRSIHIQKKPLSGDKNLFIFPKLIPDWITG
jgi:hypothetical protein